MKISKAKETKKYAINPENIVIIQMPYFDDGISRLAFF
jgi:hypothetical protein